MACWLKSGADSRSPVTSTTCVQCAVDEPLRVEVAPLAEPNTIASPEAAPITRPNPVELRELDELHDVEHELEIMLAEAEGGDLTEVQLHIVLALNALQGHNDEDAVRHIENAVGAANGEEKAQLEVILEDLRAGEAHDAEHELEQRLGQEPHEL